MSLMWMQAKRSRRRLNPSKAPWREVVHIETIEGSRGGQTWSLILDCGHLVCRPKQTGRRLGIAQLVFRNPDRGLAPKRVRCWACDAKIPSCDPMPLIALRQRAGGGP